MKKILVVCSVFLLSFTGCSVRDSDEGSQLFLDEFLLSYDLWHVNVEATRGTNRIPFINRAFTLSFDRGRVYANNNLVGIGIVGGGYGLQIGDFVTSDSFLTVFHNTEGRYRFKVIQVSMNKIELYDLDSDVVYLLEGYFKRDFNFDKLFFDNVEYFLQEYEVWEKTYTSVEGAFNPFDRENFVRFFSNNGNFIFQTREALLGSSFLFQGIYSIENLQGTNVKLLNLRYQNGLESFELRVLNDREIELFHINSGTTYRFTGMNKIIFLKNSLENKPSA